MYGASLKKLIWILKFNKPKSEIYVVLNNKIVNKIYHFYKTDNLPVKFKRFVIQLIEEKIY